MHIDDKTEELTKALEILSLPKNVSIKSVKRKYRELALIHHPDTSNEKISEKMIDINWAYKLLIEELEKISIDLFSIEKNEKSRKELWKEKFGGDPVWSDKSSW